MSNLVLGYLRHEMFVKLEKSITELHEMFMDISVMIETQGELVNRWKDQLVSVLSPWLPGLTPM